MSKNRFKRRRKKKRKNLSLKKTQTTTKTSLNPKKTTNMSQPIRKGTKWDSTT